MPASARDDPINFRKPRRETASSHSDAPLGNSRCIISLNSELPASSSRLRQNSGPFFFWISAVADARSSLSFLPGQTSSRCPLPFCLSSLINFQAVAGPTSLSVARRATRNVHHCSQMILLDQMLAQRKLVCVRLAIVHHRQIRSRLLIPHVEHLVARPQVLLRRAMALDTPFHLQ